MRRVLVTGASRGSAWNSCGSFWCAAIRSSPPAAIPKTPTIYTISRRIICICITLDVAEEYSIEISYAVVRSQTDALDLLINNAGISLDDDELGSLSFDDLLHILRVNAVAPILIAQRYLDLLQRGSDPKIVGITSEHGSLASKPDGGSLRLFCQQGRAEYVHAHTGVRRAAVTSFVLDPGWVRTDMGGRSASLSPERSVSGMIRIIDGTTRDDTGMFFRWDGEKNPGKYRTRPVFLSPQSSVLSPSSAASGVWLRRAPASGCPSVPRLCPSTVPCRKS